MALTQISTAGVKDDAVTSGKIPANAVGASELADNAVDTAAIANNAVTGAKIANATINASDKLENSSVTENKLGAGVVSTGKIADQAVTLAKLPHGTSSNDGKFLRANNGADPSFETVPPAAITAVGSTGANRVITDDGDGTATAESNLIFDGTKLAVTGSTVGNGVSLEIISAASNSDSRHIDLVRGSSHGYVGIAGSQPNDPLFLSRSGNRDVIVSSAGKVGIGMSNPDDTLDVNGTFQVSSNSYQSNIYLSGSLFLGGTGSANQLEDYETGTWTPKIKTYSSNTWVDASMNANGNVNSAKYVKIGDVVHFHLNWDSFQISSASYCVMGNLPFPSATGGGGFIGITYTNAFGNLTSLNAGYIGGNSTLLEFYRDGNSWNSWNTSGSRYMNLGGTYITD